MKVIGITGGVGAGKSTILNILEKDYGAYCILADEVGHRLMQPGGPTYEKIVKTYGSEVLREDGQINRKKLGEIVFSKEEELKKLNELTHPIIREAIKEEIKKVRQEATHKILVLEAAILKEGGLDVLCDDIWYIYAEEPVRVKRLMDSRGYSEQKSYEIISRQMKEEAYRNFSHYVIDNSNRLDDCVKQIQKRLNEIFLDSAHLANYNGTDTNK